MNAKSMPRAPLIIIGIIGGNLAVLDMHPDEHGALDRQNAGSDHVSAGCQRKIAGMTTLTVYINSTMPRVGQASRGNASREDVLRHPVEHEDLHDVRRRIHQRGRRIRTSGRTTGNPEVIHLDGKRAFRGSREASFIYVYTRDLLKRGRELAVTV
jgi:hypothetical protein